MNQLLRLGVVLSGAAMGYVAGEGVQAGIDKVFPPNEPVLSHDTVVQMENCAPFMGDDVKIVPVLPEECVSFSSLFRLVLSQAGSISGYELPSDEEFRTRVAEYEGSGLAKKEPPFDVMLKIASTGLGFALAVGLTEPKQITRHA